jgi:hypothetical protein
MTQTTVSRKFLRPSRSTFILALIAILLLAASALKLWEYATTPTEPGHLLTTPQLALSAFAVEIMLAFWLLSGLKRLLSTVVAALFFAVVASVAGYKWFSGEPSCGCFGRLAVSPWITTLLDVTILGSLIWILSGASGSTTSFQGGRLSRAQAIIVLLVGMLIVGSGITVASIYHPSSSGTEGVTETGGLIVLEPEKWLHKPFALAASIDIGNQLLQGPWRVVLYHNDCPDCQRLLPKIEQYARSTKTPTMLIELPPYAPSEISIVPTDTVCKTGKLDARREWFATTPVLLDLVDGIVERQQSGENAEP